MYNIISTIAPLISRMMCSPFFGISVWMNTLGISSVIISLFCFASSTPVIRKDYISAVGLVALSQEMYLCCMLLLVHNLVLTVPYRSSFRNMRISIVYLRSSCVKSSTCIGLNATLWCRCLTSLLFDVLALSLNFLVLYLNCMFE